MCSSCDEKVHQGLLFHNRDAFVNGYFNAIPPTVVIDEKGNMQTTAKFYPLVNLPTHCSKCKEEGVLQEIPLSGSLIIVNEKGRFDFNKYAVHCRNCNDVTPSWTIRDVVQTGYWPGSPSETSYVFDQQLFRLWDSLQKRMPGTSESSFIRALEDVSAMSGRSATINHTTFSRSFKEWKFCQHEIQQLEGMNWMKCPICSVSQHSCHVDGNMKLYRYHSSGSQRRPSYYGDLFIANKDDVDTHIKNAYEKQPKLKVGDNRCGDSHWRAANNSGRKSAKLDETGLEIAGCRHGLAQWAVNMFQGELFGYANYIHLKKMIPSGVKYFWEDIVCKYWKWARKAGGLDGSNMKPALSVMHAKAHNWTCQVIWGGRWQVGSACSTGEEVGQINSHMSRCGNTTKYMLPENREELITEHVLPWNKRKIFDLVQSLEKRYTRAIKMQKESEKDFIDILGVYNVPLEQFKADEWKNIVISHAQEVEAARAISSSVRLQDEIEMLVCNIELTTRSMNKLPDSSKQRNRLRSRITSDKAKLSLRVEEYNKEREHQQHPNMPVSCALSEVMHGNFPWGNNADTPIRIKRMIVEKHQLTKRWEEEVLLVKKEMTNFISWYMDGQIPQLRKIAEELQVQGNNLNVHMDVNLPNNKAAEESEHAKLARYTTNSDDVLVIGGKLACVNKGIDFCKLQLTIAASKFKTALAGSEYEESLNVGEDWDTLFAKCCVRTQRNEPRIKTADRKKLLILLYNSLFTNLVQKC
ncbi:uncharacterized protein [Acropora muricata]|uniref:uncharacterized protein isoform X2 n=1 Tax=Acropora muricata TaxID=159855 RepID=UPI0034E4C5F6